MEQYLSVTELRERLRAKGFLSPGLGVFSSSDTSTGYCIGTLPYYTEEAADNSKPGEPHGRIAPFARRNYYLEAVSRLKKLVTELCETTALRKKNFRIFCNSRLPEKKMAFEAGIGSYGKNSLILTRETGSLCILAGFLFPLEILPPEERDKISRNKAAREFSLCGNCRACIEACPVQAITAPGVVDKTKCLQDLSTSTEDFSEEIKDIWGNRLYGCQICQDVCPVNRIPVPGIRTDKGELGASLPLSLFLGNPPGEIRKKLKGSVLDRKWIPPEALIRNALISAGNAGDPVLLSLIDPLRSHTETLIRDAADWAYKKIYQRKRTSTSS